MLGKNNQFMNQKKSGRKFEKYSIKKLKVGAASVLVGAGFFLGFHVEASEINEPITNEVVSTSLKGQKEKVSEAPKEVVANEEKMNQAPPSVENELVEEKNTNDTMEKATSLEEQPTNEKKTTVEISQLLDKMTALQEQVNRIRSNEKQKSQIEQAEKLIEEAKSLQASKTATQKEVDAKAKEISSLTSILKSIKSEETVKENKNQDSRNGKKMEEGVGFRTGTETNGATTSTTSTSTGIGADVVDATAKPYNPNVVRSDYTNAETSAGMLNQVSWLDFSNLADWQNVKTLPDGSMALKEGSVYTKEIMKDYFIKITVKSLKPFQATEIYKNRMEAAGATEEEKATYDPTARNWYMKNRGVGAGDFNEEVNIIAKAMDRWTEIKKAGVDTGTRKTTIKAEKVAYSIGAQFEISGIYRGKPVRPAVVMTDGESANPGESVIFTTNGTGWQLISEIRQNRGDARHYSPVDVGNRDYRTYAERYGNVSLTNHLDLMQHGVDEKKGYGPDNKRIAYKYLSSPDQETGGLGSGVFGPVTNAGPNSTPVIMTKDATEVGMYIVSDGHQAAMIGFVPVDSGDAPATYGEATHTITTISSFDGSEVKQPYLGSVRPDMDMGNEKNWLGDDTKEEADEGIDQILPDNLKGQTNQVIKMNRERQGSYTLQVQAHTGGAPEAHIYGWIDFNHNGTFEENERSDLATITKDGPVTLQFNNNNAVDDPSLVELGTRVRISTSSKAIEQPTGIAGTGEVEDFKTQITHPPVGEKKTTEGLAKQTQRESIHFTARGKTSYNLNNDTAIDTNTPPVYIDNKTGQEVTLSTDGTYTVAGQGTYKFTVAENNKDINVEFTPEDGFVGEAHGITIRRQDTNGTTTDWISKDTAATPVVNDVRQSMDGLYIPKVTVPTSVNATPVNADSQNLQGLPQKGKPTFNVESAKEPVTASAKYPAKLVDPRTNTVTELTTVDAFEQGTTNKIGTYTIVPETGEVTFTPNKDFKGIPAPATISADIELTHDKDGNVTTKTLTANYIPTIIPVVPTAEESRTSGVLGKPQTSPIKLDTEETGDDKGKTVNFNKGAQTGPNGERVELNPDTLTLLDGENEVTSVTTTDGKYELDKANKTITFTPNATFTGVAKPVSVRIKDANGTKVDTTYTPTVTDVTMEGTPKETEAPQGQTQTGKPEFTVSNPDVRITGYKLINPTTNTPVDDEEIDVPEQGTYRIDKTTGTVKFIPKAGFTGPADGINVQAVTDVGKTHEAKYTPTVNPFVIIAVSQESKNIQGVPQEGTPTFTIPEGVTNASNTSRKLVDPTDNTPKDSVTVEGKGTFVIDETGKVTFTPIPSYTGEVPAIEVQATVTVTNEKNEPATITSKATYKPEIVPVKPTAEASTTSDVQGKVQTSSIVLDTEETADDKGKTVNFNKGIEQGPKGERTELNPDTLTLLNEAGEEVTSVTTPQGKYELDKANKTITFTPNKDFAGEATPVKVQIKDANGTKVETTYTPTVIEVTPTGKDSATSGLQGFTQTSPIVFNQKDEADNTTVNFETGHERVELKRDTLTLVNENGEKVTTITVPEVGTYELKDGAITFTPVKTFKGTAEGVTVQVEDENGKVVTKKYVPTVIPVTPEGENAETEGPKAQPQTSTIVFDKKDEDNATVNFNKGHESVTLDPTTTTLVGKDGTPTTEVKVPGEGTYTLANNVITFTPEPEFAGKATGVTVQVKDTNGTVVTKTYTPTVRPITTFVDEAGTPITVDKNNTPVVPEEDGKQPNKDIYGYKLVRTETDNKGNTKHIYEPAKGESVKVSYVSTTGEVLKDSQTVQPKDTLVGTAYDASTETVKSERIEKDGKVYLLKETKAGSASEKGKVSDKEQTITYVYEEVKESEPKRNYGSVVVLYTDQFGRPISGITDTGKEVGNTVLDTSNAPLNTKYDTTDNKPQTITTKDGKVYTLKKVTKNSDAEQSGVKGRTSVVTYVYEMLNNTEELPEAHVGIVLVNYQDEDGNLISGKTPEGKDIPNVVVDTDATLVGEKYDTTDNKPTVIIAENGDVYELVKASDTSVEKGEVVKGATIVDYVYRKVETKFVDENGKEIKSSEKGTKSKEEISGYVFKETKKDEKGNTIHVYTKKSTSTALIPNTENGQTTIWKDVDGNIIKTQENGKKEHSTINGYVYDHSEEDKDGNTTHIYRKVNSTTSEVNEKQTSYVDENGKAVQTTKQGQHPQDKIAGYEFVRTETDANGNVRHVYRQVSQSPATVEQRKNELPNTGTGEEITIFGAAAASILAGLGIVMPGKKKEEE